MHDHDIRWQQRLQNFLKACALLDDGVALARERTLSELEKQGLIQRFEFTHELAWNVLKDYFEYQGTTGISGSRDAVREAFQKGLIADGQGWMDMIRSRNQSSHTYNEAVADEILARILTVYQPLFAAFRTEMLTRLAP